MLLRSNIIIFLPGCWDVACRSLFPPYDTKTQPSLNILSISDLKFLQLTAGSRFFILVLRRNYACWLSAKSHYSTKLYRAWASTISDKRKDLQAMASLILRGPLLS